MNQRNIAVIILVFAIAVGGTIFVLDNKDMVAEWFSNKPQQTFEERYAQNIDEYKNKNKEKIKI